MQGVQKLLQNQLTEKLRCYNRHIATDLFFLRIQTLQQILIRGKCFFGKCQYLFAFFGDGEIARISYEQCFVQFFFQGFDAGGKRRLGNMQLFCGSGKRAFLYQCFKIVQLFQTHTLTPCHKASNNRKNV